MPRRLEPMPKPLQMFLLKKRFGNLDWVDWRAIVDSRLTFPENLHNIEKNHIEEIEHAQHEAGCKTESEKKVEFADTVWANELDYMWRLMQEHDMEPQQEEAISAEDVEPEDLEPEDVEGWHVEQTDDYDIHSIEVERAQPVSLLDREVATKEDFQTGFLARFMIVYGQRDERKPRRRWTEDDSARRKLCEDKWQQVYSYCHKTEWASRLKFDFADEALERLNEFEEEKDKAVRNIKDIKKRSIEGALLRGVCDYSIKLAALYEADAQISKLATLAIAPTDNSIMISRESVHKAINTMLNTVSLLTANLLILRALIQAWTKRLVKIYGR